MLFGYNFNSRTQFVTELEFEHVSEVYVEQAFLQYKLNNSVNLRGGLILIPMGMINEYHEPTTFNGVERPTIDNKIVPTTWREIGVGINGNLSGISTKYQFYVVNGFNGYDGTAKLSGKNGLRSGRQKGADSYISSPNFAGRLEFYGVRGLSVGISGYAGNTQSKLYNGIDKDNEAELDKADSSVVGIAMLGMDARYNIKGLQLRGQLYYSGLSNTEQYNRFTAQGAKLNDLGSAMVGYYLEAGYNLLRLARNSGSELIPFIRLEHYNLHNSIAGNIQKNPGYENEVITTGISYKLAKGVVVKADIQFTKSASSDKYSKTFNSGFGIMF